ncbi:hypothetical protein ACIBQ6_13625 [Nonomuraea sp. NPDC049655]|uniref:hypothetical protein n=1 Tax=Nonomuraea sp. NPDC049655 TaxID=3364355 RepID=UPI00378954EB
MRALRRSTVVAAVLVLLLAVAGTASADQVSNGGTVYRSTALCVDVGSTISNPGGAIESSTTVDSLTRMYVPVWKQWVDCARTWDRPPWNMAAKLQLLVYDFATSAWGLCRSPLDPVNGDGFIYSNFTGSHMFINWNYGGNPPLPPCGTAWYATYSGGYVYNGEWYGGWVPSGNMWFAWPFYAARAEAQAARPEPPAWLRPDGGIDWATAPSEIPVHNGTTPAGHVSVREAFAPPAAPPSVVQKNHPPIPDGVVVRMTSAGN